MTILKRCLSRIFLVAALGFAAATGLVLSHWVLSVRAAQRAVPAKDAGAASEGSLNQTSNGTATPVLVELFTSEGCSDCPAADALLARLLRDQPVPSAHIIVLEEHVDYWESLGWHDRFSSHDFTDRQTRYKQRLHLEDIYTPQMIVDGTDQFVGSDSAHALGSIAAASHTAKVGLSLSAIRIEGGHASGVVRLAAFPGPALNADLYAAVIQTTASTEVGRGENSGRTLHHVSVVRSLQRIGTVAEAASGAVKFSVPAPPDVPQDMLQIVVFVQRQDQGAILGAASSDRSAANSRAAAIASANIPRMQ